LEQLSFGRYSCTWYVERKDDITNYFDVQEFVNPTMVPFVLPTALQIARDSIDTDFVQFILPGI
jgi:hypothetical protein